MTDNVGNHGFGWSSTTKEITSIYLDFQTATLRPNGADRRTYGFQLRCLSE
ncbi:hypothetical protein [uncultured Rikenella sp.]|uniref:hypothetical protein n=1 Tax=uncultured Rikenella sp. TaxID=368003 RepID=UPI00262F5A3B|nr:hypothetical protein [uncultured Rikenella sp.]